LQLSLFEFLRRYYLCVQRIKAGRAVIGHVPDTENPADFMTKWAMTGHEGQQGQDRGFEASLSYLTNMKAIVRGTTATKA
jgi:hypothetical protein